MFSETQFSQLNDEIVRTVFRMATQEGHWFTRGQMTNLIVKQPHLFRYVANLQKRNGPSLALERGVATATAILYKQTFLGLEPPPVLPYTLDYLERERRNIFSESLPKQWSDTGLEHPNLGLASCIGLFSQRSKSLVGCARETMMGIRGNKERMKYLQGLFIGLLPFLHADTLELEIFSGGHSWFNLPDQGVIVPLARADQLNGYGSRIN